MVRSLRKRVFQLLTDARSAMEKTIRSLLTLAAAWWVLNGAPVWSQTGAKSGQPTARERTGEEKMEARGAQKPGRMEKQAGKEKMGAQDSAQAGTRQDRAAKAWSRQDIRKAQEALKKHGHNPGSIDGVMGARTRDAIRDFQAAKGLQQTGNLDAETAEKLAISSQ
jgi:hypothetical protein